MATRTVNTAAVAALSTEQRDALAAQALARMPLISISLWPNANRRPDKNDAHFTGKARMSTVQLAEKLAAALAEGQEFVDVWVDLWHNANPGVGKSGGDKPVLSGRARNFVEARSAQGDAQSESIVAALTASAGK